MCFPVESEYWGKAEAIKRPPVYRNTLVTIYLVDNVSKLYVVLMRSVYLHKDMPLIAFRKKKTRRWIYKDARNDIMHVMI